MSSTKERIILLLLHDGTKIEGVLIKIDKENLKMILERGKVIKDTTEEPFEKMEVSKKDIKEIRVLEEKEVVKKEVKKEEPKQEENKNDSTSDDKKVSESNETTFGTIPLNLQQKYQSSEVKYDKGGFFDALTISNNKDNFKEARTYNEKNKETFGLDENYRGGHSKKRGGYRGRGGYNSGYHHNKHYNRGGYNSHTQNYRGGYSGSGTSYKNEGGNEYN